MSSEREKALEKLLAQFIQPIKNIPFEVITQALHQQEVIPFDKHIHTNDRLIKHIALAMRDVCNTIKENPISRTRPNEVGNDIEQFVIEALQHHAINASRPLTKNGKGKSTGYPDIYIPHTTYPIYLEVKTYALKNHGTTQRSFYLSPSDDAKITTDAHHLLVGFEIETHNQRYFPVGFEIVDLYGLACDMKSEFNSDNKRLYASERLLYKEKMV